MQKRQSSFGLNQEGSALLITVIMMLLAIIIGFVAIKTATTGIAVSGSYKSGMQAFYTTDAVTKYVVSNATTFDMPLYAVTSTVTFTDPGLPGTSGLNGIFVPGNNLQAKVTYLSTGAPPSGTSSRYFQTNYFIVQTTVQGTNNSREVQEVTVGSTVTKACGESC
ncbi:MAG TPA: hypothetical protein VN944_08095 [Nitrospiria bacterium]|nr:hypothetical protein [Nitrospiria bacterium]